MQLVKKEPHPPTINHLLLLSLFQVRARGRGGVRHRDGERLQNGEERLLPHRREGRMESDHQSNIRIFLLTWSTQ